MTKLQIDSGGEYLLGYAKARLRLLTSLRNSLGVGILHRWYALGTGEKIHIISCSIGDTIRIISGGRWDFFFQDPEYIGEQRADIYFGVVGKPALRKVAIGHVSANGTPYSSRISSQLAFFDPVAGWRQIDKNEKVSAFAPGDFGGTFFSPSNSSEDEKIVAVLTNGPNKVLTDGTNYVAVTALVNGNIVLATKTDCFFHSKEGSVGVYDSSRIVSLAESQRKDAAGNLVNPTGLLQDVTWLSPNVTLQITPLINYTDLFTTFTDQGIPLTQIYRNGVLEASSSTILALDLQRLTICSKDTFSLWNFGGLDVKILAGKRQSDGTYVYTSNTYAFDPDYQTNWGTFNAATLLHGFSDSETYNFNIYIRSLAVGPFPQVIVTAAMDSKGVKTEAVAFPMTYLEYTAFPIAPIIYNMIAFFSKACFIGVTSKGTAFRRHVFFYFTDGTNALVPFPAGAAHIVATLAVGSKTKAYTYATDGGVKYLACSDGTLTVLPDPTRLASDGVTVETPTSVLTTGAIDQKEGAVIMFEAAWATEPLFTVHHWDEDGVIFDYERPALTYALFPVLGVPVQTPLRRMELIEFWGA